MGHYAAEWIPPHTPTEWSAYGDGDYMRALRTTDDNFAIELLRRALQSAEALNG